MIIEIKIPGAGESVTEAAIGNWLVEEGSFVEKDQEIAEVETDKATLPLIASESGKIKILVEAGSKVQIGDVACSIDTGVKAVNSQKSPKAKSENTAEVTSVASATSEEHKQTVPEESTSEPLREKTPDLKEPRKKENTSVKVTPLAKTIMDQHDMDVNDIINGLKKITKHEVEQVIQQGSDRSEERQTMSPLRRKLSKRLVAVRNETAMLTTFNEVDMSRIMEIRRKHQAEFQQKHGLKPGLVSFFVLACTKALMQFPKLNSYIDGDDIITPDYVDVSFAVQTEKGLMVPVIRNTHAMKYVEIEQAINQLAQKARAAKLSIEEMTGGTFTITNGGIFGSMLSTPILNPPQSAILGMHNIVDRPVVINGKIEIRPIMYVALSYDHRLIDGRDSVSFLVKVKEMIESPINMLIENADPERQLLGL
jgi:2-oxoglutarate dehydrogenase E2 component (dihydrolipoamide succinyltransferase)